MPDALDQLAIAARRSGKLAGNRLRFNRPLEQLFFHYKPADVALVPSVFRGTRVCDHGSACDEYAPARQLDGSVDAVVHAHQDKADSAHRLSRVPGPKDGIVAAGRPIPHYGIGSVRCRVVRPGPRLTVELLDGVWGERFNPTAFANALARGAGNAAIGMGVRCR